MSTGSKVVISMGVLFALGVLFLVSSYFGYANKAVALETRIEAGRDDNEQILGQYRLKITEMVGVTGLQADQFEQVYVKAIDARYKGGMGKMMAWIKEQNPQLGTEVYTTLQRTMDAGREKFSQAQTRLRDVCRVYDVLQREPYSRIWMGITGYPSSEYEDNGGKTQCRLVTSEGAKKAFDTGIEKALDVRGKPQA